MVSEVILSTVPDKSTDLSVWGLFLVSLIYNLFVTHKVWRMKKIEDDVKVNSGSIHVVEVNIEREVSDIADTIADFRESLHDRYVSKDDFKSKVKDILASHCKESRVDILIPIIKEVFHDLCKECKKCQ